MSDTVYILRNVYLAPIGYDTPLRSTRIYSAHFKLITTYSEANYRTYVLTNFNLSLTENKPNERSLVECFTIVDSVKLASLIHLS